MWVSMRVSRLYSDQPAFFPAIDFTEGLNVVMAEIRLPENRQRDTHNLGKSTLGRMLDFGFLAGLGFEAGEKGVLEHDRSPVGCCGVNAVVRRWAAFWQPSVS